MRELLSLPQGVCILHVVEVVKGSLCYILACMNIGSGREYLWRLHTMRVTAPTFWLGQCYPGPFDNDNAHLYYDNIQC